MNWDDELDIVCTGSRVRRHRDGRPSPQSMPASRCWQPTHLIEVDDDQTIRYFREVSQDLIRARRAPAMAAPIRVIDDSAPAMSTPRRLDPFIGSGLQNWAASCLASPCGFLYSRVVERKAVTMRSSRGESYEVTTVGAIELGPDLPQVMLGDWLSAQADDRDIEVRVDSPLKRLVLEDARVLPAVLRTPSGMRAVRARRGILVSTGG